MNEVFHCSESLLSKNDPNMKTGHRHKVKWSTSEMDSKCFGKERQDRTFDKIVARSVAFESGEVNRQKKLAAYF